MASRMHEYKKTSWELRGATGAQHRHIEQKWQGGRRGRLGVEGSYNLSAPTASDMREGDDEI
eukprot:1028802-Rhodomonas_salina.1